MLTTSSLRRFLGRLLVCSTLWASLSQIVDAEEFLTRTDPKAKQADQIYQNLIRTIGDTRQPPELRLVKGKASSFDIALYTPKQHRVLLEVRYYDLAQRLSPSVAPHALALILGHELAHFYRSHPWALEFGKAFADRQRGQAAAGEGTTGSVNESSQAERKRIEAEADYFGGYYSFLAGYSPLRVADQVFDAIYREYRFDQQLPAYEHLQQRKRGAQDAQTKLGQLVPLFQAGLYLSFIRDYRNAARIFDRVAAEFPGPEMFNNAGVALANAALQWSQGEERPFMYPFQVDVETRLTEGAGRGPDDVSEEERRARKTEWLEQAKARFEKAVGAAPSYAAARINLACALDLLGEHDRAFALAREALALAKQQGREQVGLPAYLVLGIAAARLGRTEDARRAFLDALAFKVPFAEENLAALQLDVKTAGPVRTAEPALPPLQPERVGDLNVADLVVADLVGGQQSRMLGRWEADEDQPELRLFQANRGATQVLVAVRGSAPARSTAVFLSADPASQGSSVRGLSVGQPAVRLQERYGAASAIMLTPQGPYHLYENRYRGTAVGLLVGLDGAQAVRDWVAYRIEE